MLILLKPAPLFLCAAGLFYSTDIPLIFHNVLDEQKVSESRIGLGNTEQRPKVLDDEKPPTCGNIHHNVELNDSSKASNNEKQHKRAERNTSQTGHLHGIVLTKPSLGGNLHRLVPGLDSRL